MHHWCCWHWWQIYRWCCWYLKSANSWAQFAIKNPQISEIFESKNFKSANFFRLNRKLQTRKFLRWAVRKLQIRKFSTIKQREWNICKKFGTANRISANCKKYWVRKSQIHKLPHLRKVLTANWLICYLRNLFAEYICGTYLRTTLHLQICHRYQPQQQKILWYCPIKAKHQRP